MHNTGCRPVQVGSHFHFFEVNRYLQFDREAAFGKHLKIPATTAIRFEPGEEKEVELVACRRRRFPGLSPRLRRGPAAIRANCQGKNPERVSEVFRTWARS